MSQSPEPPGPPGSGRTDARLGLPSGIVTFLFTDLQGSTRLWETEPDAMPAAYARHDALLQAAIVAHDGVVYKVIGDAVQAAFPTASGAVAAALTAQRGLLQEPWPTRDPLRVRMAVHTTTATPRADGDYRLPGLNRLGRLLDASHGGQVLLGSATAELARDMLPAGAELRDLGEQRLKDLAAPERIFQLLHADLPADFPPLRTLTQYLHNLPFLPTPFIGREQEAARLVELLAGTDRPDSARLLTLTGPGGVGKTRLELQVAAAAVERFPDGVWFVDLSPLADPDLVPATIAQALGIREGGDQPLVELLRAHLRDRSLLLVLDNFEQVTLAAPLVTELLVAAAKVKVLVSSRVRLGIRGEHEYRVQPLGLPPLGRALPAPVELSEFEAVRLFIDRAQAVRLDFALTVANAAAVGEICHRLDGLPLAIELAAARVRLLPPAALLRRLEDRLGLLIGGGKDRPERQQTLRGAIAWSHDLLPADQQTLFARLSVFAGGWDLDAAEAVASSSDGFDLLSVLEALVDHSLVRQEEAADGEPRFAMLATIREFAREQLGQAGGEAEMMRRIHAEYYLALAERAEPELTGPEQAAWLDRLAIEHDNLRSALSWWEADGAAEQRLRLVGALWRFWDVRGHLSEGRQWLERALARANGADPGLRAKALKGAGGLAHRQGEFARARELHEQELAACRAAGDRRGAAEALVNLGSAAIGRGDYGQATGFLEESLTLFRDLGDRFNEGLALNWLGAAAFLESEYDRAAALYEESLALNRQVRHKQGIAFALVNLAEARQHQGDLERALDLYHQALPLFRELGDARHMAFALLGLGVAAMEQRDAAGAMGFLEESLALSQDLGDKAAVAGCLERLAQVAAVQENFARAARLFGAADALRDAIGAPRPAAYAAEHGRHVAAAEAHLGPSLFAAARDAGQRLSLDEIVALATARATDAAER